MHILMKTFLARFFIFGQILHFWPDSSFLATSRREGIAHVLLGRGRGIVAHSRLLHVNFMSKGSLSTHAPSHLRRTCGEGGLGVGGHGSVHVLGVGAGCM